MIRQSLVTESSFVKRFLKATKYRNTFEGPHRVKKSRVYIRWHNSTDVWYEVIIMFSAEFTRNRLITWWNKLKCRRKFVFGLWTKSNMATTLHCGTADQQKHAKLICVLRFLALLIVSYAYINGDVIQHAISDIWKWLRTQWWYRSVYNETIFVVIWSFPVLFIFRLVFELKFCEKYR